jgi:16S rRNA (cytosine1402-N4)-methyltransferase
MMPTTFHTPVMLERVIEVLRPASGETFLDGTVGGGGHAEVLLERIAPDGRLIGLDVDDESLAEAGRRLERFGGRVRLVRSNFGDMKAAIESAGIAAVDGVLLDLGGSSHQFDTPERGFSFREEGPLDMRQDRRLARTAADILAESSEEELIRCFRTYGEEPLARRIAVAVVQERALQPITRTTQLADLVRRVKRGSHRSIHPATLVFQALRIAVNDELSQLRRGLEAAVELCRPGGRIAVIAFHSLEDRIVKDFMRRMSSPCVCPPALPVCRCGQRRRLRLVQRKAFQPTGAEVAANPRARSARLRAAERIEE